MITRRFLLQSAAAAYSAQGFRAARAENAPGVSDAEIKIGQTMPYSGPVSAYGVIGRTELAYFKMINEQGGVSGRKINLISVDDAYSPPKTVEQVRRLVEDEKVAFLFQTLGTPSNLAIRQYCNDNKVPQLLLATGATTFSDPQHFPWTMRYNPSYRTEARIYVKQILANKPNAKIGVLYQNDDFGKDYLAGLKDILGSDHADMIVKDASYEVSEPTVDSQVVTLQASGADVFLIAASPKFAAQAIRKIYDIGWKPTHFLSNVAISVKQVMQPAGPEKGIGIISAGYGKEPTDPQWHETPEYKEWLAWMQKYNSSGNITDANNVYGYSVAQTMVHVLKAAGDNLTRENLMKQAASIHDLKLPMLLPGIIVSTSADDFAPIKQMQLEKFDRRLCHPNRRRISSAR